MFTKLGFDRNKNFGFFVVLAALALATLACGVGGGEPPTPTVPPPTAPPPTPIPPTLAPSPTAAPPTAAPPTAAPSTGGDSPPAPSSLGSGSSTSGLDIVNESNVEICALFVTPSTSEEWGDNQIGSTGAVAQGETFTLTDIPVGTYDLLAEDCQGNGLAQEFDVVFTEEGITWTLSGDIEESTVQLDLINDSSVALCYLYVSPSDAEDWGPDQFGEAVLEPGMTFTLEGIVPGQYDMLIESCDGLTLEEYGLDLTQDFTYTVND